MADLLGAGAGGPPARNRRVIVWFRRDLRLADNPALVAALRMAPEVVRRRCPALAARGTLHSVAPLLHPLFPDRCLMAARLARRALPATGAFASRSACSETDAQPARPCIPLPAPAPGARVRVGPRGGRPVPAGPLLALVAAQEPGGAGPRPARPWLPPALLPRRRLARAAGPPRRRPWRPGRAVQPPVRPHIHGGWSVRVCGEGGGGRRGLPPQELRFNNAAWRRCKGWKGGKPMSLCCCCGRPPLLSCMPTAFESAFPLQAVLHPA
jgi:hypothetical protein